MENTYDISCPYNKRNKYWCPPEEIMPYPKKKIRKISSFFKISVDGEGDDVEDADDVPLDMPENEDDFECGINVRVYFNNDRKTGILAFADYMYDCLPGFLQNLDERGYANWQDDVYGNVYLLAWKKKNNIRFIVQVYDESLGGHLYILFDRLISGYVFYSEFKRLMDMLKYRITQREIRYEEYKRMATHKTNNL